MGKWKWFQFDVFSSLNSIFPLKKTNKQSIKFCKQTSKLEKVLYKIDQTCVQPLRKTLHQTSQSVTLEIWNQSTCWRGGKSSGVKQNGCHCGLNCHITGYRFVSAGTLQTPNQHKPFNGASTQKHWQKTWHFYSNSKRKREHVKITFEAVHNFDYSYCNNGCTLWNISYSQN